MKHKYLAAVDIGGTKITVSIVDKKGILVKLYQPSKKKGNNKTIPSQVDSMINLSCKKIGIKKKDITAVGIATAGPFEKKQGNLVLKAVNLCGGLSKGRKNRPKNTWKEIPLERELKKKYKNLQIENDATASAIAEHKFGAGKGEDNFVYVTWSTGIGAGAFVDGKVVKGKNKNSLELGHIFIAKGDQDLEVMVAGPAIAKDYGNNTTPKQVFEKYRKGNKKAKKIIQEAVKNFARGLAASNSILDTKLFILGGSVMNDHDVIMPLVKKEFCKSLASMTKEVKFKLSGLGKHLGDLSGLTIIMPKEWIKQWQKSKPWKKSPEPIKLK